MKKIALCTVLIAFSVNAQEIDPEHYTISSRNESCFVRALKNVSFGTLYVLAHFTDHYFSPSPCDSPEQEAVSCTDHIMNYWHRE